MRPAVDAAASAVVDRAGGFQVRSQSSGKSAPTSPTFWEAAPDFQIPLGSGSVAPWMPCFSLICNAPSSGFRPFDSATLGFAAAIGAFIDVPVRLANGFEVSIGRPVTGSMRVMTFGSFIVPARTFQLGILTGSAAPMPGRKPSTILDDERERHAQRGALPRTKRLFGREKKRDGGRTRADESNETEALVVCRPLDAPAAGCREAKGHRARKTRRPRVRFIAMRSSVTALGLLLFSSSHALQLRAQQRPTGPPRPEALLRLRGGGAAAPPPKFQAAEALSVFGIAGFSTGYAIGKSINVAGKGATTVGRILTAQSATTALILAYAEKFGALTIHWDRVKPTINCALSKANAACKRISFLGEAVEKVTDALKKVKLLSGFFDWLDGTSKDSKATKAEPKHAGILERRNNFANTGALVGISCGLLKGLSC